MKILVFNDLRVTTIPYPSDMEVYEIGTRLGIDESGVLKPISQLNPGGLYTVCIVGE